MDCGYSLEPPRRGGSNEYPPSMFLSRNKKNNVYPCKPSHNLRKYTFCTHTTKTQISLGIHSLISLPCSYEETLHPWLSKMCWVKILIRLHKWAGWFESLLENTFSDITTHFVTMVTCSDYVSLLMDVLKSKCQVWSTDLKMSMRCETEYQLCYCSNAVFIIFSTRS